MMDEFHLNCRCEPVCLRAEGGEPVLDEDVVARIITSPEAYDLTSGELLRRKLTSVWSAGLSVIQRGASNSEILSTVELLTTGQAEPQILVGAAVMPAKELRAFECTFGRWFAVYATDAPGQTRHADILATVAGDTNNQKSKIEKERRLQLTRYMAERIKFTSNVEDLIQILRAEGV